MNCVRCLISLALTIVAATALAQEQRDFHSNQSLRTTSYDPALGEPTPNEREGLNFPGPITITGTLRAVPEEEMCDGFCLSFIPDQLSDKRLPHRLGLNGNEIPIDEILVFEGDRMFEAMIGPKAFSSFMAQSQARYDVPAEITLRNFQVYVACDKTFYEGEAVVMRPQQQIALLVPGFEAPGC